MFYYCVLFPVDFFSLRSIGRQYGQKYKMNSACPLIHHWLCSIFPSPPATTAGTISVKTGEGFFPVRCCALFLFREWLNVKWDHRIVQMIRILSAIGWEKNENIRYPSQSILYVRLTTAYFLHSKSFACKGYSYFGSAKTKMRLLFSTIDST